MNVLAKFDEIPSMILQDIKETKRYGHTDGRSFVRSDDVKTVYPPQTKFAGGIITTNHIQSTGEFAQKLLRSCTYIAVSVFSQYHCKSQSSLYLCNLCLHQNSSGRFPPIHKSNRDCLGKYASTSVMMTNNVD